MKKEEIEKKKKIRELVFKIIHSITYVLSALFVIVCIAVGVQRCNSKNKNKGYKNLHDEYSLRDYVTNQFSYTYESMYQGTSSVDLAIQQRLIDGLSNNQYDLSQVYSDWQADINFQLDLNDFYIYNTESYQFVKVNSVYARFSCVSRVGGQYSYRLWLIDFYITGDGLGYCQKAADTTASDVYTFSYYPKTFDMYFYTSISDNDNPVLNLFFNKKVLTASSNYILPTSLNYYYWAPNSPSAIWQTPVSALDIIKSSNFTTSSQTYRVILTVPYFISNGKLYNQLVLDYLSLGFGDREYYFYSSEITENNQHVKLFNSGDLNGWGLFQTMAYAKDFNLSDLNSWDIVYQRVNVSMNYNYTGGSRVVQAFTQECQWKLQNYRSVQFLSDFDDSYSSYTPFQLLTTLSVSIGTGTDAYHNLFNLLALGFSSIKSILDIELFPMLSLGVLLFAPLLFGIIVIIFRMVKK